MIVVVVMAVVPVVVIPFLWAGRGGRRMVDSKIGRSLMAGGGGLLGFFDHL